MLVYKMKKERKKRKGLPSSGCHLGSFGTDPADIKRHFSLLQSARRPASSR